MLGYHTPADTVRYHIGDKVVFGRPNGEQTHGTVVKINRTKLKIRQDETRGNKPIGTVWGVPPSLVQPAVGAAPAAVTYAPKFTRDPASVDDWWLRTNKHALRCLGMVYCHLSPENLTCDGERSRADVQRHSAILHRKMQACFVLLERDIDEGECYKLLDRLDNLGKKG